MGEDAAREIIVPLLIEIIKGEYEETGDKLRAAELLGVVCGVFCPDDV